MAIAAASVSATNHPERDGFPNNALLFAWRDDSHGPLLTIRRH